MVTGIPAPADSFKPSISAEPAISSENVEDEDEIELVSEAADTAAILAIAASTLETKESAAKRTSSSHPLSKDHQLVPFKLDQAVASREAEPTPLSAKPLSGSSVKVVVTHAEGAGSTAISVQIPAGQENTHVSVAVDKNKDTLVTIQSGENIRKFFVPYVVRVDESGNAIAQEVTREDEADIAWDPEKRLA